MNKIKLMTHVVVGYPSLEETVEVVSGMAESGVDFVELQIPFSDPLADGPTIMQACEKSLDNGTKVRDAFMIMKRLTGSFDFAQHEKKPIRFLFMCYYNTVFKYGVERFCRDAAGAGAYGLIVPDMPLDEEGEEHFLFYCKKYNLHAIRVISPNSTDERLKDNAKLASGFVYLTSRQGITGASKELDPNLAKTLQRVRKYFKIPIAVGFGISKKEHVRVLQGHADIAVVGSAIIDVIDRSSKQTMLVNVKRFITELKK